MKNTNRHLIASVIFLTAIAWFLFYYYLYPYHQFHKEQTLLFLYSADALQAYATRPALLARLAGDFLTQFYYYAPVAALVPAAVATATGWLSYQLVRRVSPDWIAGTAAWLLMNWEMLRFSGLTYPLASSLSLLAGLGLYLLYRTLKNQSWRLAGGIAAVAAGYYLFGYGVYVFALAVLLQAATEKKAGTATLLIPLLCLALPPLVGARQGLTLSQAYGYPATGWWDMPDLTHERLLGLDTESYLGHWKKVKELSRPDYSIHAVTYYHNLANAAEGRLCDGLLDRQDPNIQGLFLPVSAQSSYLSTLFAAEGWFRLGDMTMAEHATLLGLIFSPNHQGTRMLKRLAEINLINGDEAAALKYLRILSKTHFYRQWAAARLPGQETEDVKAWLAAQRKHIPREDTLRASTTDVVKSLRLLLRANPQNEMARDYLLCFHLLTKNIPGFLEDYLPEPGKAPRRLYAEALLIGLVQRKATSEEIEKTIVDPQIMQAFKAYTQMHRQYRGSPSALTARFGKTYWFYYHYASI